MLTCASFFAASTEESLQGKAAKQVTPMDGGDTFVMQSITLPPARLKELLNWNQYSRQDNCFDRAPEEVLGEDYVCT